MSIPSGLLDWCNAALERKMTTDEFLAQLKDGAFLCRLLNCILPLSPIQFAEKPNRFQRTANILSFLAGCRELGVTPLFPSDVLLAGKDLSSVFACLEGLRRLSAKNGFQPEADKRESTLVLPITPTAQSLISVPVPVLANTQKESSENAENSKKAQLAAAKQVLLAAQLHVHKAVSLQYRLCIQCQQSYIIPHNYGSACRFHGTGQCCENNKGSPCQATPHRSKHHSDWKYPTWSNWYTFTVGRGRTKDLVVLRDGGSTAMLNVSLAIDNPQLTGQHVLIWQPSRFLAIYNWPTLTRCFQKGRTTALNRKYAGGGLAKAEWTNAKEDCCSLLVTVQDCAQVEPTIVRIRFSHQLMQHEVEFKQDNRLRVCRPPVPYPPIEPQTTTYFEFPPDWIVGSPTEIPVRGDLALSSKLVCRLKNTAARPKDSETWYVKLSLANTSAAEDLILTSIQLEYRLVPGNYVELDAHRYVDSALYTKLKPGGKFDVRQFWIDLPSPERASLLALNSQHALRFRLTVRDFLNRVHVSVTEVPRGSQCQSGEDRQPERGALRWAVDSPEDGLRLLTDLRVDLVKDLLALKLLFIHISSSKSIELRENFWDICRAARNDQLAEYVVPVPPHQLPPGWSLHVSFIIDKACNRPAYCRVAAQYPSHCSLWILPVPGPSETNKEEVEFRPSQFDQSLFAYRHTDHKQPAPLPTWEMFGPDPPETDIDFQPLDEPARPAGEREEEEEEDVEGKDKTKQRKKKPARIPTTVSSELVTNLNHQVSRLAHSLTQLASLKLA